jgi:hypothetical protein
MRPREFIMGLCSSVAWPLAAGGTVADMMQLRFKTNWSAAVLRDRSIPHGFGFVVSPGDSGRRERFRSRERRRGLGP